MYILIFFYFAIFSKLIRTFVARIPAFHPENNSNDGSVITDFMIESLNLKVFVFFYFLCLRYIEAALQYSRPE